MSADLELIQTAVQLIKQSKQAVVLTGAGISTPSGIPDFRSSGTGLWEHDNPMVVASLSTFRRRPEVFFNWLRPLVKQMVAAEPNPAHYALAELEKLGWIKAVVTQNIDGLHQRAGSNEVIEVHGGASTFTCPTCAQTFPEQHFRKAFLEQNQIPRCPDDQNILKPDIVMFEEMLPERAWLKADHYFQRADLVIVVGSSLEVAPAGSLPYYAVQGGARLIINNYSETYLDREADLLLPFDVALVWPEVVKLLDQTG